MGDQHQYSAKSQQILATACTYWSLISSRDSTPYALPAQRWAQAHALATPPRIAQAARQAGFGHVRECRPALGDVVASIESLS